ncbi:MAG: hydrolase [Chloroflexota bacterium]|nr:MAG: hydrolase [Chloroflexota bacterium]
MRRHLTPLLGLALLAIVIAGLILPAQPQSASAQDDGTTYPAIETGDYRGRIESGGAGRFYLLHVPPGYDGTEPLPLVLSYHGFTGDPVSNATGTGWSEKADQAKFFVVYPAGQNPQDPSQLGWFTQPGAVEQGWLDDVRFTQDLILALISGLNIDVHRIYLTGFSNGAGMVHRLACDLSGVIAAAGPVSGPYFQGDPCDIAAPVPIFSIHGTYDRNAPFDGYYDVLEPVQEWIKEWAERDGCEAEPTVMRLPQNITQQHWAACEGNSEVVMWLVEYGQHSWPRYATDVLWTFFEAHPLPE